MNQKSPKYPDEPPLPSTWDARLARHLVRPLKNTGVSPNHLTTLRLLIGIAGIACIAQGGYAWSNWGALLVVISNFVDHTDGELARISGKSSKIGHFYDLASDALITVLLFVSFGMAVANTTAPGAAPETFGPVLRGTVAGLAVALIFFLRMRIESRVGKSGTKQASAAGFETEDVLYLLPLVTLADGIGPFLTAASIGAPLFALLVIIDYWRVMRRPQPVAPSTEH